MFTIVLLNKRGPEREISIKMNNNREKKTFWECHIDDTIIAPENLIWIMGIDDDVLAQMLACEDNARLFCQEVQMTYLETY